MGRNEHGQDLGEAKAWMGTWWLTGAGTSVLEKAQCLQVGSHGVLNASPGPRGALSALLRPCSLALWLRSGLFLGSHRTDLREKHGLPSRAAQGLLLGPCSQEQVAE